VKVFVVVSDCGLNGPWVHGVYTTEPDPERITDCRVSGTTGYQGTSTLEFEVDAVFK